MDLSILDLDLEDANICIETFAQGGAFVNIHESAEDYLEAILKLRENGYITLLPPGEEIAQRIYSRHKLPDRHRVKPSP